MERRKIAIEGMPPKMDFRVLTKIFNETEVRKGEMPSANCHGSARGMAELSSIMANKGQRYTDQDRNDTNKSALMCEETWKLMHDEEKITTDANILGLGV